MKVPTPNKSFNSNSKKNTVKKYKYLLFAEWISCWITLSSLLIEDSSSSDLLNTNNPIDNKADGCLGIKEIKYAYIGNGSSVNPTKSSL